METKAIELTALKCSHLKARAEGEEWKQKYVAAQTEYWDFEGWLAHVVAIFDEIVEWADDWRTAVLEEQLPYDPEQAKRYDHLFSLWADCAAVYEGRLREVEQDYGKVVGAEGFRRRHREVLLNAKPAEEVYDAGKLASLEREVRVLDAAGQLEPMCDD